MTSKRLAAAMLLLLIFLSGDAQCDNSTENPFITVDEGRFLLGGSPYCFVGANTWYGAYLGADTGFGDRTRLQEELDQLRQAGITNLRILGASESSALRDALKVTFSDGSGARNEALLEGLDFLLDEMAKRGMKAVIYLNNFWEWSGGMATYLHWAEGGEIIDPSNPDHPWPAFAVYSSGFYANEQAKRMFRDYVRALVSRRNSVSGVAYAEDPTIMAWQLANEPRPGHRDAGGHARLDDYYAWINDTAELIKGLDANHLVSTGSEGTMGCLQDEGCYLEAHRSDRIDYLTFHVWPNNWGWYDELNPAETFDAASRQAADYITHHLELAARLGKPVVMEEFGLNRDMGSFSPASETTYRDRFYQMVFERVEQDLANHGPFSGSNFWAWGGSGRAGHEDFRWQGDDRSYMGDPPQEAQGLYSVLNSDKSTLQLIRRHAQRLAGLGCGTAPTAPGH